VEELGKIQSTQAELAAVLGCSVDTVKDRLKCDPEFSAAYIKGLESGKASLRRLQWKAALGGNITMQIWLGKQYLAQSDRQSTLLGQDPEGDPVAFVIDARPGQRGEEPTS
jgi:transcriptional regulator with XRE-family HTH domain